MPKYEVKLLSMEERYPDGTKKVGRVAFVPIDDAAKVSKLGKEAMDSGAWTPKDPDEIAKAQKRLDAAEYKENVRRGIIRPNEK